LIFRGAGDTFCAGDDIKDFLTWTDDDPYWQGAPVPGDAQTIEDLTAINDRRSRRCLHRRWPGIDPDMRFRGGKLIAADGVMPEIDWDITPGWGGVTRLGRFAGRRKTKEWNLIGQLFSAEVAERHDMINRICAPDDLDKEVDALIEVMSAKNPVTVAAVEVRAE